MGGRRRILYTVLQWAALAVVALGLPIRWLRRLGAQRRPRSIWSGTPIITMALNARAERMLGCNATSVVTHTYFITREFDRDFSAWQGIPVVRTALPYALFVWACWFADRLHFYCDQGLLPSPRRLTFNFTELKAYRLLGVDVFLWTYGADVRSRDLTRALGEPNCCSDCTQVGIACICDGEARRGNMERIARLARAVFAMGDMIEYVPGSRNDVHFWPIDLAADGGEKYRPVPPVFSAPRTVRIVHAPNHRMFKGTRHLEQAVAELKLEGEAIELVLVERVPNRDAVEIYRSADIIFDQCLTGFHGYFALEGMALGKPVMCFIRKPAEYLLHPEECPIINTHPGTLKEDIRRLVRDPASLTAAGERGRRYVERHFTLEAVAGRLETAYREMGIAP